MSGPAAGRDTVVIGTAQEPDTLHPLFRVMNISDVVLTALFLTDAQVDDRWNVLPLGVERLPSLADGTWRVHGNTMVLTWRIRSGRRWHDGRPVTCADYVFTHRVGLDQRVPVHPVRRKFLARVSNITCPDGASGRTVVATWRERDPYAQITVANFFFLLPRHVLEPLYRASPARFDATGFGLEPNMTVGDGPFRLTEWRRGQSLTVESVGDHSVLGPPRLKRITWRFFANNDASIRSLLSGSIDVVSSVPLIDVAAAVELERQGAGRLRVFYEPGGAWEHVDFNLDNPLLQDVRVRRALAHGINRTQIVQQLFFGRQPVAHSYLPLGHPGYTADVRRYPYDPARAKALLREVGFTAGSDGIMQDVAGRRLSLELSTTSANPVRERIEKIIQEQLHQIGVEITLLNLPGRVFFFEYLGRRRFKAMAMYAWLFTPLDDCDFYFTSDGIPSEPNSWTGTNYPGYRNNEMDELCKGALREVDQAKRRALLQATARIFARDLPALPLYHRVTIGAAKSGLQNYTVPGMYAFETWNAHQWYWR